MRLVPYAFYNYDSKHHPHPYTRFFHRRGTGLPAGAEGAAGSRRPPSLGTGPYPGLLIRGPRGRNLQRHAPWEGDKILL